MMLRNLISAWRDQRGVAAIELAMVAPVIAGLAVLSLGVWDVASRKQDMRAALDVGAEYYMNGGSDDEAAKILADAAWRHKPSQSTLTASRSCRCGSEPLVCTSLCTGNVPPSVFVTLTATGVQSDALMQSSLTYSRVTRVR